MFEQSVPFPIIEASLDFPKESRELLDSGMRNSLYEALRNVAERVSTLLRSTTDNWQGSAPDFPRRGGFRIRTTGGNATITIIPVGNDMGINKWVWLDRGTDKRYAMMSKDWTSKTQQGMFQSGRGAGRVVLRGREAFEKFHLPPQPGIEPREWSEMAREEMEFQMPAIVDGMISKALRKAGF